MTVLGGLQMEVNGLKLPDALEQIIRDAQGEWTPLMMKEPVSEQQVNSYGDEFDCGDLELYDYDHIVRESNELPTRFSLWEAEVYNKDMPKNPGAIPWISDYSKVLVIGQKGSGAPFCLDYRDDPKEPKVFYLPWYGACWRRVAPNFAAFLELVVPYDADEYDRRIQEEEGW